MNYSQIVSSINIAIVKYKPHFCYHEFFIGVSDTPEESIYLKHNISESSDWFVILPVDSFEIANEVIRYFSVMGMYSSASGIHSPEETKLYIYCYGITINTKEI